MRTIGFAFVGVVVACSGGGDNGDAGSDAGNDVSLGKDTSVAPKDTSVATTDSRTSIDSGVSDDTGSSDDTDPGTDSDLVDTGFGTDTAPPPPPDGSIGGTCAVHTDCSAPLNCCDKATSKCGIWFIPGVICLPF